MCSRLHLAFLVNAVQICSEYAALEHVAELHDRTCKFDVARNVRGMLTNAAVVMAQHNKCWKCGSVSGC